MFRFKLIISIVLLTTTVRSQKATISGYVRDAESGETLIGANIHYPNKQLGTATNNYGFYSFTLEVDSVSLVYSYVGYQPQVINLKLLKDTVVLVKLKGVLLDEIVVSGERTEKLQESTRMSTFNIPVYQIKRLPALMGETDVIKVLQLLPGVQGGNEGSTGLYVRGGGPDQNLILLDGVPVYNVSHLYGFFSTFNADAINHVELVKGGFPARYGGRLSSVVDISMKEGHASELHGQASLGLIASKMMVEGPIKKDKTTFIFSARRSYLNLLKAWTIDQSVGNIADKYYFYDLNAKINHKLDHKNRVYLSVYTGKDDAGANAEDNYENVDFVYGSTSNSDLNWGNLVAALRWNHIFNKKLFSNITATYSKYHFQVLNETSSTKYFRSTGIQENQFYKYKYNSSIRDFATRVDLDFVPNPSHYFRLGVHAINHRFTPGVLALNSSESISSVENLSLEVPANELSAYLEDDWDISNRFKVNVGMHASTFLVENESYPSLQPRISLRYLFTSDFSMKTSYSTMQQNVHLLTNAGIGLPTDLWVPATGTIRPQTSQQSALGLAYNLKNEYEISVEGYYKSMNNLIEYKDGASYLNVGQNWQDKVEAGSGESYGMELFVQKKMGKVNGWVGYTLSWNNREFANLNGGKSFPYRYDRRHDAKITMSYLANDRVNFGLTWVFGTGNAVTIPLNKYDGSYTLNHLTSNYEIWDYGNRNNFRMGDYHRLDFNANYSIVKKWGEHRFTLSVYNVYARKNPFYLTPGHYKNQRALLQVNLFSIVPSLSYSVQF